MHNKNERESCSGMLAPPGNSQLYCSSLPTSLDFSHRDLHTTIYTQRIIQVFLLAVGCDWLNGPNMAESDWLTARERDVSFEKADRGSKQAGR